MGSENLRVELLGRTVTLLLLDKPQRVSASTKSHTGISRYIQTHMKTHTYTDRQIHRKHTQTRASTQAYTNT